MSTSMSDGQSIRQCISILAGVPGIREYEGAWVDEVIKLLTSDTVNCVISVVVPAIRQRAA